MKKEIIGVNFIAALNEKVPNRTQLANFLVDLLMIEKEAVYRRLRGDVSFTFAEVALIAQKVGISLDQLVGICEEKSAPYSYHQTDFESPGDIDFIKWDNFLDILGVFKGDSSFNIFETWTTLPFPIIYRYPHLTKFYIFKWVYQVKTHIPAKRFEDIIVSNKFWDMAMGHMNGYMQANELQWIFDEDIFSNLIKDLKFFTSVRLIKEESIEQIKKELTDFLNYLEEVAIHGKYKENDNKVSVYISDINIDTNYSCIEGKGSYITLLRTLTLTAASSIEESTYHYVKNWFTSIKRLSTLISICGVKQRIEYFKKQRDLVDTL